MSAKRPKKKLLLFTSAAVLLFFLLLEIGVRLFLNPPDMYVSDESYWVLEQHTNLFGQHDNVPFIILDEIKVPKSKPAGKKRILCLGSSSTYGAGLENRDLAFPGVLDQLLPEADVLNVGFGGYNSYQLYIYLSEVLVMLHPDLVIFYYGGNEGYGNSAKLFYPKAQAIAAEMRKRGITDRWDLEFGINHGTGNRFALAAYRLLDLSRTFLWLRKHIVTTRYQTDLYRTQRLDPDAPELKIPPDS
ncbi:MAG: SGNH/GDSL hydrolase family protein, partial [Alphaproteobacteria bacterium]